MLTVVQAAEFIGCTPGRVRQLIRSGSITAKKISQLGGTGRYAYQISITEARRIRDNPRIVGRPRTRKV